MSEWLGLGMILVGGLVAMVAPIGSWVALVRLADTNRVLRADPAKRLIATLDHMHSMLVFAAIVAAGLCVLVFGLVVGYGTAA